MKNLSILMAIFAMMSVASTSAFAKGKPANKCHPQDLECICANNPDMCVIEVDPPIEPEPCDAPEGFYCM